MGDTRRRLERVAAPHTHLSRHSQLLRFVLSGQYGCPDSGQESAFAAILPVGLWALVAKAITVLIGGGFFAYKAVESHKRTQDLAKKVNILVSKFLGFEVSKM